MRWLICVLALLAGQGARADWSGFYTAAPRPAAAAPDLRRPATAEGACVQEILRAQLRYQIPGNLLLAIGLQEAGMMKDGELTVWPWVANAAGDGRYFESREEVEDWVFARVRDGEKSIDLGCMQINILWHPDAFDDLREGFDPARNVDYSARLLLSLYEQTGDWISAAGRYHSATAELQAVYLERLKTNAGIANDRIETFRALASAGGEGGVPLPEPRAPLPAGHFWTAWMTQDAAAGQGARSLYAREALEPVLPNFRKMF
ncbi:lytic transglycosylase domain-containing protein [Pseudooceanicola sp.]|uniref:lytic transglycosylase domain-containing protein n=1 Tax=Pseudooceanicola sp. TaxID=1914328 RepID=UPI0035143EDF